MEQEARGSCVHQWEPWFTVVERAGLCFFFPGARCVRCRLEKKCANDQTRALTEFKKQFDARFEIFAQASIDDINEIVKYRRCHGWRIAQREDYRMILP